MKSCLGPSTSGAAGSGAKMRGYGQTDRSWSYTGWLPAGFFPDWTGPPGWEYHAGNTSGAHSRPGTHSLGLVPCDTQMAEQPSMRWAGA